MLIDSAFGTLKMINPYASTQGVNQILGLALILREVDMKERRTKWVLRATNLTNNSWRS